MREARRPICLQVKAKAIWEGECAISLKMWRRISGGRERRPVGIGVLVSSLCWSAWGGLSILRYPRREDTAAYFFWDDEPVGELASKVIATSPAF